MGNVLTMQHGDLSLPLLFNWAFYLGTVLCIWNPVLRTETNASQGSLASRVSCNSSRLSKRPCLKKKKKVKKTEE